MRQAPLTRLSEKDAEITELGECRVDSPLIRLATEEGFEPMFVADTEKVLVDDRLEEVRDRVERGMGLPAFELAGARRRLFFNPATTRCAIVTCGGVCPGLNDVIRAIVMQAHYRYGVEKIYGIRYGYEGLIPEYGHPVDELTPEGVTMVQHFGGTALGTSRGQQDVPRMVDRLLELGVSVLFVVGGDGSQRGANDMFHEAQRRGKALAVVGVPKTIDNDLLYMDKSFGYETAFSAACGAVMAAHTEALASRNGVGLVKLMGRDSGFIACSAALATGDVNFVLIPEVPFTLDGEHGLLAALEQRLAARRHAVIVVAEGAGQDLAPVETGTDRSGNKRYLDIGTFLRDRINEHFTRKQVEVNLKYIDPSYTIRSVPASANDSLFCAQLGRHAVHAAMAGKTGMVIGRWHHHFVHLPVQLVTQGRQRVDPSGDFWLAVLESTGQPAKLG